MHVKNTNHTNQFNVFLFVVYRFEAFLAGLQFGSPGLILKSLKKKTTAEPKVQTLVSASAPAGAVEGSGLQHSAFIRCYFYPAGLTQTKFRLCP